MITRYVAFGIFVTLFASTAARAQSAAPAPSNTKTTDLEKAKQMFKEAWEAANQQNHDKACPLFDAALALAPNYQKAAIASAQCYAEAGKYVTAVDRYLHAQEVAAKQAVQDTKMLELISTGLTSATNNISYVTIYVPGAVGSIDGISVSLNGNVVASSTYGLKIPLNCGNYQMRAMAPNHKAQIIDFKIEGVAKDVEFTLAPLVQTPPSPDQPTIAPPVAAPKKGKPDQKSKDRASQSQSSSPANIVIPATPPTPPNPKKTNRSITTTSQIATIQEEPAKTSEMHSSRKGGVALIFLGGGLITGASFLAKEAMAKRPDSGDESLFIGTSVAGFIIGTATFAFGIALAASPSSPHKLTKLELHSPQVFIGSSQIGFQARW